MTNLLTVFLASTTAFMLVSLAQNHTKLPWWILVLGGVIAGISVCWIALIQVIGRRK